MSPKQREHSLSMLSSIIKYTNLHTTRFNLF